MHRFCSGLRRNPRLAGLAQDTDGRCGPGDQRVRCRPIRQKFLRLKGIFSVCGQRLADPAPADSDIEEGQ